MATKPKKSKTTLSIAAEGAKNAGIVMMAAAATLGLVEVPHDPDKRALVPHQPAFAFATANANEHSGDSGHEMRRERDEVHPHAHAYSLNQRTPGRTRSL